MIYSIDSSKSEPAYIQLYRQLVSDIVKGTYAKDSKLPSKRNIAQDTGVSILTVQHALELLSQEGYIEPRERSGNYVIYSREDFVYSGSVDEESPGGEPEKGEIPAVKSATGDFPFTVMARAVRKVLSDSAEHIFERSPNEGCIELREQICRYLARNRGLIIGTDQIIIGSGAEYLYGLIVQFLGRDRLYGIEKPSYRQIMRVYEAMGARCEELPLGRDGIESKALYETGADVLHITPFNSYPSLVTATISKKHEYIRWAKSRGAVLIEDNYDSELTVSRKPEEPLFSMAEGADIIYINTFSRTIAPSVRVGYMILSESMVEDFRDKLGFYSCTVPVLDQLVLAELLKSGDFERHINRERKKRRRAAAGSAFTGKTNNESGDKKQQITGKTKRLSHI